MYIVSDRSLIAASFQIRDLPLVETFDGCGGSKAGTGLGKKRGYFHNKLGFLQLNLIDHSRFKWWNLS